MLRQRARTGGDVSDVSEVTRDMSYLFYGSNFNADISNWNTSGVTNMLEMFRVRFSPALP